MHELQAATILDAWAWTASCNAMCVLTNFPVKPLNLIKPNILNSSLIRCVCLYYTHCTHENKFYVNFNDTLIIIIILITYQKLNFKNKYFFRKDAYLSLSFHFFHTQKFSQIAKIY